MIGLRGGGLAAIAALSLVGVPGTADSVRSSREQAALHGVRLRDDTARAGITFKHTSGLALTKHTPPQI